MCYPLPGPRCSEHAQSKLQRAQDRFKQQPTKKNRKALKLAEAAFSLTPASIATTRSEGMNEIDEGNLQAGVDLLQDADRRQAERERLIATVQTIRQLKEASSPEWVSVASDPSSQPEVLTYIAEEDQSYEVQSALVRNPASPASALKHIFFNDDDENFLDAICSHPNAPKRVLSVAATYEGDDNASVRLSVTRNEHTPDDTLIALTDDWDEEVREGAIQAVLSRKHLVAERLGVKVDDPLLLAAYANPAQLRSILNFEQRSG